MSQPSNNATDDLEVESSSNDSSRLSTSTTSSGSGSSTGTGTSCSSNECRHSCHSSEQESNGHIYPEPARLTSRARSDQEPTMRSSTVTEESTSIERDDAIQQSQSMTGPKCDTATKALRNTSPSSPRTDNLQGRELSPGLVAAVPSRSASTSCHVDRSSVGQHFTSRTNPSTSSLRLDSNNNKNSSSASMRADYLQSSRRNNFSKSASGSRLAHRNESRSKVCDCLSQQCDEKEHSNRRQFIENYYNSRTRLPSANAMSTLNISTPLNRLSECDAITKRLLSSPIRAVNFSETPSRRVQIGEIDKSRRASLGTNTLTEQVSLFTSSQFNSLEINYGKNSGTEPSDDQRTCDPQAVNETGAIDLKHKHQQGRSLSVCQDDSLKRRFRIGSSNHSSNLSRAVSLACESGATKQRMTIIPLFGCDIGALEQFMRWGLIVPPAIESAIDHILSEGVNSIGIFRKSGVKSRILTLKQRIESNQEVGLEQINRDNEFSIYDIADLVKMWFRELKPMPIMTKDLIRLISNFLQSSGSIDKYATSSQFNQHPGASSCNRDSRRELSTSDSLRLKIDSIISPTHKALFLKALNFFASISSNSEINQMTSQNLAICLTPSLCATESDQNSIIIAQKALKYCIDNYQILF